MPESSKPRLSASAEAEEKARNRGLPAVQQARDARAEGKMRWPSPKFWAYSGIILAISAILHWKWSDAEVERTKQKLLADQRGVAAELGPRWLPLRERIEGWVTTLAHDPGPDVIDHEALSRWDFRHRPGIYLRLRTEDAQTPDEIRTGARDSLRDGFTACLMRVPNPSATAGKECKRTRDCPTHEFCNEQDHCSRPAQPFNLRVAYRTMHILTEEWVREVQASDSELRTRLYVANFEDAIRDELPLAAELLDAGAVPPRGPRRDPQGDRGARSRCGDHGRSGASRSALGAGSRLPPLRRQDAAARPARLQRRAHRHRPAGGSRGARGPAASSEQLRPGARGARGDGRHQRCRRPPIPQ